MASIFLCLGTNIGNRKENLNNALDRLARCMTIVKKSTPISTDPQHEEDQPFFLNRVIRAETMRSPQDLLATTQAIEAALGRTKTWKYGPRLIDIDILYYDDLIIHEPQLTIPHPLISERRFVLEPMAEIEPNFVCPAAKKTIAELLAALDKEVL